MRSTQTQTQNWQHATSSDSTWSDGRKLSRKIRELAHRSHRFLKTSPRTDAPVQAGSQDMAGEQRDLVDQIDRLPRRIHEHRTSALIPWFDALHHLVEDRLKLARKAGEQ